MRRRGGRCQARNKYDPKPTLALICIKGKKHGVATLADVRNGTADTGVILSLGGQEAPPLACGSSRKWRDVRHEFEMPPGLSARPYFNRYTDDAIDLCDVLSSFAPNAKASLHELCRVMGFAGKPQGMDGGEVEKYYRDGRIKEIAEYCESDVINTYRVWLRYELFRGKMTKQSYEASEANLQKFLEGRNTATSQTIKTMESELIVR